MTTLSPSQVTISITEWFEKISHPDTELFRQEDSRRKDRLDILRQVIGIRYDAPTSFPAQHVLIPTKKFQHFLAEHGHETCGLRLNPTSPTLPKLRLRGQTINQSLIWLKNQAIDPRFYNLDFIPHSNHQLWSTIFVVNNHGIYGEIIKGGHYQLSQGFYDTGKPITFALPFTTGKITLSQKNSAALHELTAAINLTKVTSRPKQSILAKKLKATFAHNHLFGYFETLRTKDFGLWMIDYNRTLGALYKDFTATTNSTTLSSTIIRGSASSQGKARGLARIVRSEKINGIQFNPGEILICDMTTPDFVPLMTRAAAIITDQGGILSHAAIISRELKKPCIVGTNIATKLIKNGDLIEVDAFNGTITILPPIRNTDP